MFVHGSWGGNDVDSPGQTIAGSCNLPAGTYMLVCWIPDADMGRPHAYMACTWSSR